MVAGRRSEAVGYSCTWDNWTKMRHPTDEPMSTTEALVTEAM